MNFDCHHLLKVWCLSDDIFDIFEEGDNETAAAILNHELSFAVKEKAKPLIEGIIFITVII
jgi:hypothetical protein